MRRHPLVTGSPWLRACWVLFGLAMTRAASAQQVPQQEPFGGAAPNATAPRAPSPATPAIPVPAGSLSREELEAKVLRLEAMVNQLSSQMQGGVATPGAAAA